MDGVLYALQQMTENMNRLVEQGNKQRTTENPGGKWDAVEKLKNLKTFDGKQGEWEEFSLKLKCQVAAGFPDAEAVLKAVEEKMTEAQVEEEEWDYDELPVKEASAEDISKKLNNFLMNLTTGEANAVVRRCRGNGLWAWKKLSTTLNPRTLASGVKMLSAVLHPSKINNTAKADHHIETWEDKVKRLEVEYGEEV